MATLNEFNNEGIYYRAIILKNNDYKSIPDLFKGQECSKIEIPNLNVPIYNITIKYFTETLPSYLQKNFIKDGVIDKKYAKGYPINLIGIEYIRETKCFFIAAPILDLLLINTENFNNSYQILNLKKLFNINFLSEERKQLKISRINANINAEMSNSAQTITLFGDDLLKSNIIKYIVEGALWDKERGNKNIKNVDMSKVKGGPFMSIDNNFRLKLEPNSCKVTITIPNKDKYGINIDKYGNFSFYLKNKESYTSLITMLDNFFDFELFSYKSLIHPLRRSDESLKNIET
jgi:hypothetical protein